MDRTNRTINTLLSTGLLSALCTLHACTDSPDTPAAQMLPPSGTLEVKLIDAPLGAASEIWVEFDRIELKPCGGPWIEVPLAATAFDLLTLQGGVEGDLVSPGQLPNGSYCELRFGLVDADSSYIVIEGQGAKDLEVPSGQVKLKVDFDIAAGMKTQLVLDFDAKNSVHETGHGSWILRPVVSVADVSYSLAEGDPTAHESYNYRGYTDFLVLPDAESTHDLLGGGEIEFPLGAVSEPTWFTAVRWEHPSSNAASDLYRFSPAYEFLNQPVIRLDHSSTAAAVSMFIDGTPTPSWLSGDRVVASAPHFCDFECGPIFVDVEESEWYAESIHQLAAVGVIDGEREGEFFRPLEPITRAELLRFLVILVTDLQQAQAYEGMSPFSDVPAEHWAHNIAGWAHANGLITGDLVEQDEGDPQQKPTFRPDEALNRAEAAKMFVNASEVFVQLGRTGGALGKFAELYQPDTRFDDCDDFDDVQDSEIWYYDHVYAMRDAGLMSGYENSKEFGPENDLLRGEATKIMCAATGYCPTWTLESRLFCGATPTEACEEEMDDIEYSQCWLDYDAQNPTPGNLHAGIDIPEGRSVYSPVGGTIIAANTAKCGKVVLAEEGDSSTRHIFLHMVVDEALVEGQSYPAGTLLGQSSDQDDECVANGVHLHYEIRQNYTSLYAVGETSGTSVKALTVDPVRYDF